MRPNLNVTTIILCAACAFAEGHALATPGIETAHASGSKPVPVGGMLVGGTAWPQYKERFVSIDGRIIDTGNGGISHSEGQGYGLLIAVASGDRTAFDLILVWTRKNLFVRNDNLAAWKWSGRDVGYSDRNNATDGDILIAWALAEAADYWSNSAYLVQSRAITRAIVDKSIEPNKYLGPLVMPAAQGFSNSDRLDGQVVNLSYWVFPAFARFQQIVPEYDWNRLARTGTDLVEAARFGKVQLPTDWIALGGSRPSPALGFSQTFGYNSIRIPLYLVWSGAENRSWMQSFATAGKSNASGVPIGRLDDETQVSVAIDPGYRHIADLTRCAAWGVPYPEDFYHFSALQNYYPATMDILALMAAVSSDSACLDREALGPVIAATWRRDQSSAAHMAQLATAAVALEPPVPQPPPAESMSTPPIAKPDMVAAALLPFGSGTIVSFLQIIGLGMILGFAVFLVIRHLKRRNQREMLVLQAFSGQRPHTAAAIPVTVPRVLPLNPFDSPTSAHTFEGQIELAAQACLQLSRTIGIIYFELDTYESIEICHGPVIAGNTVANLALELRRALRSGDHVAILNQNQIVVCITLLSDATDLKSIACRLQKVWRRTDGGSIAQELHPGLAVYPMHGYQGGDLIESARTKYRLAQVAQTVTTTPIIGAITQLPMPVTREIEIRKASKRTTAAKAKSLKVETGSKRKYARNSSQG